MSMDSNTTGQFLKGVGGPKSTRNSAIAEAALARSTISAGRASRQAIKKNGFFTQATQMTNNINLGRLPTLGLNQIKLEEFQDQDNNLFRIQPNTEKMLVARELEREFKDLNKFDKSHMRVWDKGTSNRIDRAGTIRVVNGIPALKPHDKAKGSRALQASSVSRDNEQADEGARPFKQKTNIFDVQDS